MAEIIINSAKVIGKVIREKRKEQGLKQSEAAGLLGVGVRFLSELERGNKETLSLGKVIQVVNGLGCNLIIDTKKRKI